MPGQRIHHLLNVGSRKAMGLLQFKEMTDEGFDPVRMIEQFKMDPNYFVEVMKIGESDFNGIIEDSPNIFVGYKPLLARLASHHRQFLTQQGWIDKHGEDDIAAQLFESMITRSAFPEEGAHPFFVSIVQQAYQHRPPWIHRLSSAYSSSPYISKTLASRLGRAGAFSF